MKPQLDILLLEDNSSDAELVPEMLRAEGVACDVTWVKQQRDFLAALDQRRFDVILSDYTLPGFDGLSALAIAKQKAPDCPVIFLSGTLGEEAAVESLKQGATDYVLKDRPARLATAIQRALRESAEQVERKRTEEELKRSRAHLRALAARLLASREGERVRISREIHDEFGELLTGLKLGLTWIRNRLSARDETIPWQEVLGKIDVIQAMADTTGTRVRELCTELRPSVLDDLGLLAAIEWQARAFKARTNIRCEVSQRVGSLRIGEEQATGLFRIFQETLTNVARHANASKVSVALAKIGPRLVLKVRDNGNGISASRADDGHSLGILGMRERATLLGGTLAIQGRPGKGTTVAVSIPLEPSLPKAEKGNYTAPQTP